jgi:hypothetical protein
LKAAEVQVGRIANEQRDPDCVKIAQVICIELQEALCQYEAATKAELETEKRQRNARRVEDVILRVKNSRGSLNVHLVGSSNSVIEPLVIIDPEHPASDAHGIAVCDLAVVQYAYWLAYPPFDKAFHGMTVTEVLSTYQPFSIEVSFLGEVKQLRSWDEVESYLNNRLGLTAPPH